MQQKQQRKTSIFSVCAPSDIQGLERWEAHLHPLEQAGALSVWSMRHLQAGSDRGKLLHDHLDQADLIVLLLSADFFSDEECEALMKRALAGHQQGTAQVIPLLLRPVVFHETPLSAFTALPSDGRPVTLWHDPEAAFDDCVRSLCRILGRPVTQSLVHRQKRISIEEQNRARMRERLQRTYEELLAQSLAGVTQMELGLSDKPDAVQNAATLLFRTSTRTEQLLPPGTSILHVYDEATHELLILGAPGAGKSTLLVELARQLVVRAEADETHPLPVILPLSSWAIKRPPLHTWLAEQVAQIYHIPKKVARRWIDEDQLLPLLDGLDEMDEAARPDCIERINAYHRDHPWLPLVICSRQVEYEQASKSQRLALQNAVVVQPLTHKHVQAYLKQAGKTLAALRRVLATNPTLASVATTPLMVRILILTYQGTKLRRLSTQNVQLQQQVWTDYVQRMIERKRDAQHYLSHQTIMWLGFLARQMRDHSQTVFYIEHMQPDWLVDKRLRWKYDWLAVRLPYILVGALVGLAPYPEFFHDPILTPFLTEVILLGGLLGWLLGGGSVAQQSLAHNGGKTRGVFWYRLLQQLGLATLLGSGMGLSFWKGYDAMSGLVAGLSFAGCCLLLILLLRKSNIPQASVQRTLPPHPIRGKVVLNALLVGLLAGLSSTSARGPEDSRIAVGLLFLLLGGLSGGILSVLLIGKHVGVQPADRLIWTWQSFGRSLFSKHNVRLALLITGVGLLLFSAILWLGRFPISAIPVLGLLIGSIIGLCSWLLLGLFRGVASTIIDDQLRMVPNQGIRHSALNALRYGLVVALLVGLGGRLLSTSWLSGLIMGLSVGLLAGLFNGGLACLRHSILRLLLWHSGAIPWDYSHFLDAVAERILLRKVGGGYIFVHRLLLDYLTTLGINELTGQRNAILSHPSIPTALLPCGHELRPNDRFCSVCGAAVPS